MVQFSLNVASAFVQIDENSVSLMLDFETTRCWHMQ